MFDSLSYVVTLKIESWSPKSNQVFYTFQSYDTQSWLESIDWFKTQDAGKLFWTMYNKVAVIMSRSLKSIVMNETIAQVIHICTNSSANN